MQRAHFEVVADVQLRHWWFVARRRILHAVLACAVPPDPAALVVDVGCGAGANIASLADRYRCIGIDTSADAIEFARDRFRDVEFVCGVAPRDLGARVSSARAMLLMDVLEHVEDDRAVVASLVEALQPGAILLITVPADMRLWSAHDEGLLHHRRYDVDALRRAWSGLPVEPLLLTHFCTRLYPLARLQRSIDGRLGRLRRREEWDMTVPVAPVNQLLERTFAGEAAVLVDCMKGRRAHGYTYGVSLMALLRREERSRA